MLCWCNNSSPLKSYYLSTKIEEIVEALNVASFRRIGRTSKISGFKDICKAWWLLLLLFIYGLPMCQSEQEWRNVAEEHGDNIPLLRMVRNIGNSAKMKIIFFPMELAIEMLAWIMDNAL